MTAGFPDPSEPRPDGRPTVVTDPAQLETPLLRRILGVLRKDYDPEFAFRWLGPIPWTPLAKPLREARVALVSTSALHLRGDAPFDPFSSKWGDSSLRVVPHLTPPSELDLAAEYLDGEYIAEDPEVTLPMRALQSLVDDGLVAAAAPRHVSFCGGVVRPYPAMAENAARTAAMLREDGVDAALVLPTCSLCVINVCVIARELESRGIATATFTLLPELSDIAGAPRLLAVKFPFGAPCGNPNNPALHRAVVEEALDLLVTETTPGETRGSRHAWREGGS